jgi:hypothetical protein
MQKLVASMPKRLAKAYQKEGWTTRYKNMYILIYVE